MSKQLTFQERGWNDYLYWQTQDRKTLKKLNQLLEDISRNEHVGLGSPEPLKGNRSGWWSRKIDSANRLVYRINGDYIEIAQCRSHYDD